MYFLQISIDGPDHTIEVLRWSLDPRKIERWGGRNPTLTVGVLVLYQQSRGG